jgi:hypothetical protein
VGDFEEEEWDFTLKEFEDLKKVLPIHKVDFFNPYAELNRIMNKDDDDEDGDGDDDSFDEDE